jgi:hypothetical protein
MKALNIIKVLVSLLFILILLISFSNKDQEKVEAEEIEQQLIELEKSIYFLGHDKAVQETWVEDINEAQKTHK